MPKHKYCRLKSLLNSQTGELAYHNEILRVEYDMDVGIYTRKYLFALSKLLAN